MFIKFQGKSDLFQNNRFFQEKIDHPDVAYYISNISRKFGSKRMNTEFIRIYF